MLHSCSGNKAWLILNESHIHWHQTHCLVYFGLLSLGWWSASCYATRQPRVFPPLLCLDKGLSWCCRVPSESPRPQPGCLICQGIASIIVPGSGRPSQLMQQRGRSSSVKTLQMSSGRILRSDGKPEMRHFSLLRVCDHNLAPHVHFLIVSDDCATDDDLHYKFISLVRRCNREQDKQSVASQWLSITWVSEYVC